MRVRAWPNSRVPSERKTSTQCRSHVGPPSATLAQHDTNIVSVRLAFAGKALLNQFIGRRASPSDWLNERVGTALHSDLQSQTTVATDRSRKPESTDNAVLFFK